MDPPLPTNNSNSDDEGDYNIPVSWQVLILVAAVLSAVIATLALYVLVAIARATQGFTLTFHVYLLFILLPDALLNLTTAVALMWEGTGELGWMPRGVCLARNGASFFYYYANLYLNAVVARQVYVLVVKSHRGQRTQPPAVRTALCQVVVVYLASMGLTLWFLADINASPFSITDYHRCDTILGSPPEYHDDGTAIFNVWTSILASAGILLVPFVYVFGVAYVIWKRQLLPVRGRTRAVAIYFFRIVIVFAAFYVPNVGLAVVYNVLDPDQHTVARFWVLWIFYMIVPFQCLVTLRLAMGHAQISQAVREQSSRLWVYKGSMDGFQSASQLTGAPGSIEETKRSRKRTERVVKESDDCEDEWNAEDVYENQNGNATKEPEKTPDEPVEQAGV